MSTAKTYPSLYRVTLLFSLLLPLTSGCKDKEMEANNARLQAQVQELQQAADNREKAVEEVASSLDAVQKALDDVRAQEMVTLQVTNTMDTGTEKGRKDKEKMLSDIAGIKQVLEDRKKELAALEDRLSKMQGENKGLVKTVAKLRALVAEREARIKDLETAVSERDAKLAVMETVLGEKAQVIETQTAAIQEKDATIQKQADTLNTGYYISGNKEFLKTHGIIKESGGVLGLGKTLVPSDLSAQDFTAIPIQQTTELPLACEPDKVKILSAHPESSYALESAGKDQSRLKILNADVFWKSRYLVVLLKC